jgi:hypothetical protein
MLPGDDKRLPAADAHGRAYRFEIGGGHWIFGGDPSLVQFIESLTPLRRYQRRSAVFFSRSRTYVDYPLQDHLEQIDPSDERCTPCTCRARRCRPTHLCAGDFAKGLVDGALRPDAVRFVLSSVQRALYGWSL